jgi:N-acetylmuramoyl-L-alanine amidase
LKTLTYLAFIGAVAFILLVLLLKLDVIPIMNEVPPQAGQARPTLIIDPGHGGEDGGAVAADGTLESELNLQISNKLELIAAFFGADVIKTRDGQDIVYPDSAKTVKARKKADQRARLELISSHPDAVLISVHQNKYTSQSPKGSQVFYAKTEGSKELAEKAQELLRALPDGASERIAMPVSEDVYIMKNAPCTAVLAECGFISNPNELAMLKSDEHQTILAAVLAAAYLSTCIRTEAF